jgi:hypothetical protein
MDSWNVKIYYIIIYYKTVILPVVYEYEIGLSHEGKQTEDVWEQGAKNKIWT